MSKKKTGFIVDGKLPERGESSENLWALIAIDPDGNESICGRGMLNGPVAPLFTSKWENVKSWMPYAQALARHNPKIRVVVRQYSQATDIQEITP